METDKKLQAKKEWTKPELLVLVRNKPEEAVLVICKFSGGGVPTSQAGGCMREFYGCSNCDTIGTS